MNEVIGAEDVACLRDTLEAVVGDAAEFAGSELNIGVVHEAPKHLIGRPVSIQRWIHHRDWNSEGGFGGRLIPSVVFRLSSREYS
jgi:hypothetical protein